MNAFDVLYRARKTAIYRNSQMETGPIAHGDMMAWGAMEAWLFDQGRRPGPGALGQIIDDVFHEVGMDLMSSAQALDRLNLYFAARLPWKGTRITHAGQTWVSEDVWDRVVAKFIEWSDDRLPPELEAITRACAEGLHRQGLSLARIRRYMNEDAALEDVLGPWWQACRRREKLIKMELSAPADSSPTKRRFRG